MDTDALSLPPGCTSVTEPSKSANGPLMMRMVSPTLRSISTLVTVVGVVRTRIRLISESLAGIGFFAADEFGDARRVAHNVPRIVIEKHFDQHVAGEEALFLLLTFAVLDFGDGFLGHFHAENLVAHVHRLDAALEIDLDLVFVAGVRVNDIPAAFLALPGRTASASSASSSWPTVPVTGASSGSREPMPSG